MNKSCLIALLLMIAPLSLLAQVEGDGGKGDRLLSLRILHLPPHLDLSEETKGGKQ